MEIPAEIEQIILRYDQSVEAIDVSSVETSLMQARATLAEKLPTHDSWVDLAAFFLQTKQEEWGPWNTYFGPCGSGTDKNGNITYYPDISSLTSANIEHWKTRALTLKNPVLVSRYADLVWELQQHVTDSKPEVKFAHLAIDAYIQAVSTTSFSEALDWSEAIERALIISISIKDTSRIDECRKVILSLLDGNSDDIRTQIYLSEALTTNKKSNLNDEEYKSLIIKLEKLFAKSISSDNNNPWNAEEISGLLINYYRRFGEKEDISRVCLAVSESFEKLASEASSLQAVGWLDTAANFARQGGFKDRYTDLRIRREEAIKASNAEMKPYTFTYEVKKADIDQIINTVINTENWQITLIRIAIYFIPRKNDLIAQAAENAKNYPLSSLASISIMAADHVAAHINAEDETDGPIFRTFDFTRQSIQIYLSEALDAAVQRQQISAEEMASHISIHELYNDFPLLVSGIKAWMNADYVKSFFVLVPLIEDAFRELARKLGEPVTKEKRGMRGSEVSMNLGDFLSNANIKAELGEDIHFWFRAIFSDPKGMNLRNIVAHGLAGREYASYANCDLVIVSLIALGRYKEIRDFFANKSSDTKPARPLRTTDRAPRRIFPQA